MLESYRPIIGDWETEKGIIMSIHMSPDNDVTASVKKMPGFISKDVQSGKTVISHIKPLVDGGYRGTFEMPDGLKPVRVKLLLFSPDTLLIMTWDKRAKSKIMRWYRVRK